MTTTSKSSGTPTDNQVELPPVPNLPPAQAKKPIKWRTVTEVLADETLEPVPAEENRAQETYQRIKNISGEILGQLHDCFPEDETIDGDICPQYPFARVGKPLPSDEELHKIDFSFWLNDESIDLRGDVPREAAALFRRWAAAFAEAAEAAEALPPYSWDPTLKVYEVVRVDTQEMVEADDTYREANYAAQELSKISPHVVRIRDLSENPAESVYWVERECNNELLKKVPYDTYLCSAWYVFENETDELVFESPFKAAAEEFFKNSGEDHYTLTDELETYRESDERGTRPQQTVEPAKSDELTDADLYDIGELCQAVPIHAVIDAKSLYKVFVEKDHAETCVESVLKANATGHPRPQIVVGRFIPEYRDLGEDELEETEPTPADPGKSDPKWLVAQDDKVLISSIGDSSPCLAYIESHGLPTDVLFVSSNVAQMVQKV